MDGRLASVPLGKNVAPIAAMPFGQGLPISIPELGWR